VRLRAGERFSAPITLQETNATWIVSLLEKLQRYEQAEEMFQELERKVPAHLLTAQRSAFWHACDWTAVPLIAKSFVS